MTNMTASRIARITKGIFTFALNINTWREGEFSADAKASVDNLCIRFVDAIDEADNDGQKFYTAMRDQIRWTFMTVAGETFVNRQEDPSFFAFDNLLAHFEDVDEHFMTTISSIHAVMELHDNALMNSI